MTVSFPTAQRNYCVFDYNKLKGTISKKESAIPLIKSELENNPSEEIVVKNLYIINEMLDRGLDKKYIFELYPTLSKFNDTNSPNIQTFLAGIYRKTKIPDGFGPLVKMLVQDSINPPQNANFDPTEEIGGAILDYLA